MTLSNLPPLVTIFGGSGFVGRHVVRALAKRGYRIRVAVRRPDLAGPCTARQCRANLLLSGQSALPQVGRSRCRRRRPCDQLRRRALRKRPQHLRGGPGFRRSGGRRGGPGDGRHVTHISAIGADANSESSYARTKGRAEAAILETLPAAVILRPSIIFGPEDGFFNKFAEMARFSPVLPLIGGGNTRFQPVYVTDVAEAVARSVDGKLTGGTIYELGGPQVLSFRECLDIMLKTIDRKRSFVSLPFGIASLMGSVASLVPFITPPLTADQVVLLKSDNVVSAKAEAEGRTLAGIGIEPTMLESILPTYLVRYRPHGQYTRSGRAA